MSTGALAIALALLAANAWFVALEFAILASRRTQINPLAQEGRRAAVVALDAIEHRSRHLAGAQLGITMASLGLGAVAEPAIAHGLEGLVVQLPGVQASWVHPISFVVALGIVVFAHMVFGEMVPKNLAIAGPERMLLVMARVDRGYQFLVGPVVRALDGTANAAVRVLGVDPTAARQDAHTPAELASMIAASRAGGLLGDVEHELLTASLDLATATAGSVMVPRERVVAASVTDSARDIEAQMRASGHSRLPVVRGGLDDVAGFVHVKDVLAVPEDRRTRTLAPGTVRRMLVVSRDESLETVLARMRRARVHLGVVTRPEDGHNLGIVTLEDVLEELVGDIVDETDRG